MTIWYWLGSIVLFAAGALWWLVPLYVVEKFDIKSENERANTIDNYRKTMGQALGAVALIVTFAWTLYKDRESIALSQEQLHAQTKQFNLQQKQAQDQFTNQQFISAAGLLKEKSASTRVAGLYAIQQIADPRPAADGKNIYLIPAIRAAVGFIKSTKIDFGTESPIEHPIGPDTQSAINILAQLNENPQIDLDFRRVYLVKGDFRWQGTMAFRKANFQSARLYGAVMSELNLTSAKFDGSYMADWEAYGADWNKVLSNSDEYENTRLDHVVDFTGANLSDAGFDHVKMGGVLLDGACLAGARFYDTDLSRASFLGAKMGGTEDCNFAGKKAHFYKATLIDVDFTKIDVAGVNFESATLSGADFSQALHVDQERFKGACVDERTRFPASFTLKLDHCPK